MALIQLLLTPIFWLFGMIVRLGVIGLVALGLLAVASPHSAGDINAVAATFFALVHTVVVWVATVAIMGVILAMVFRPGVVQWLFTTFFKLAVFVLIALSLLGVLADQIGAVLR